MKRVKLGMCMGHSLWFLTTRAKIAFVLHRSFRERYSKTLKRVVVMSIAKKVVNPKSVKDCIRWNIDTSLFHFRVEGYVEAVKTNEFVNGRRFRGYKYKALPRQKVRYQP